VLELWTSRGNSVVELDRFWAHPDTRGETLEEAPAKTRVYLRIPSPASPGDRVFRVRSAKLLDEVEANFDNTVFQGNNGVVTIDARIIARQGKQLETTFRLHRDGQETEATAYGETVEPARTKALTVTDIQEHVGRVGGTPFSIRAWDIQLDENVGMGFSALHRLRAEALEALTEQLLKPWRSRSLTPREELPACAPARKGKPRVAAIVRDSATARAAVQGGAELIYLHSLYFEALPDASQQDDGELPSAGRLPDGLPVIRLLPSIMHDHDAHIMSNITGDRQASVVNNLGELEALREADCVIEAGPSLGICNDETLRLCARLGLSQAWLSPELNNHDIARVSPSAPLPLTLTVFGQQEVMVTEHCILMARGPCDRHCASCSRRKAPHLLEDRKGYRFPVRTDNHGRSHLFNAIPLDLIPSMPELVSLGLSTLVVDGTLLNTKELKAEVARAVRARDLALRGAGSLPKRDGSTTGHFFRGVR
jgi:putative protease